MAVHSSAMPLAAALREGVAARRFFRPLAITELAIPAGESSLPRMEQFGRVADFPAPRSRVPLLGWMRRIAKRLIAPWLEQQSEFNAAALSQAEAQRAIIHQLVERLNAIQREVIPAYHAANVRLSECLFELEQLKTDALELAAEEMPSDSPQVVEGLFLHTRIGTPPGRVLMLGADSRHALDLACLGFQVVQHTGDDNRLPFADESFDSVVAMGAMNWAEASRVLTRGGHLLGLDVEPPAGPLTVREVVYAHRVGHGWSMDANRIDTEVTMWVTEKRS